jgi:DNA polymerase elongation subunit (family B)
MSELLFGVDNTERIVRIEVINNNIYEYIQDENRNTYCNVINSFSPVVYNHSPETTLRGTNYYNNLVYLNNYKEYDRLPRGRDEYLKIHNLNCQYLLQSGKTLFKGMTFDEISTLGFDIETTGLDPYKAKLYEKGEYLKSYIPNRINKLTNEILAYFEKSDTISLEALYKELCKIDEKIDKKQLIFLWKNLYDNNLIEDLGDTVEMISLYTNYEYSKVIHEGTEVDKLNQFIYEMYKEDPNLVLTYNGNSFDIPFLMWRAHINKIKLGIGREGYEPEMIKIQLRLGVKNNKDIIAYNIFGRNCIDLLPIVKKFDFVDRRLVNYQLKNVISSYGLERKGRIILNNKEIQEGLKSEKTSEKYLNTLSYCLDDSRDLINLHRFVSQADFYITQMLPFNYDTLCFQGNVDRLNLFILREYFHKGHSVPKWESFLDFDDLELGSILKYQGFNPELEADELYEIINKTNSDFEVKSVTTNKIVNLRASELQLFNLNIEGAKVQADDTGIYKHIIDSDVGSMYPSLMIKYNIFPSSDNLEVIKRGLLELREMRFKVKAEVKTLDKINKKYQVLKAQDTAFKVLLNSFFGDLGSNGFHWKDSNKCAEVTRRGRELITSIRDFLIGKGYKITSLDTDGVSYTNNTKPDIEKVNKELQEFLPDDITIETEYYKSIIVFAKKTYCAIKEDGDIKLRGAALTGSRIPPIIKRFINKICILLSESKIEELKMLYKHTKLQIEKHELPIEEFSQIQKITKSVTTYQRNLIEKENSKKDKVYDLAIESERELTIGDKVETYHAIAEVEKKLSATEIKKRDALLKMDTLFGEGWVHPKVKVDTLKWIEDYNNDINVDYYLKFLENTATRLLLKSYDEKTSQSSGVLSKEQFEYILEIETKNINDYCYRDYAYVVKDINSMSKWQRIHESKIEELILKNNTDEYITIQKFKNPTSEDVELCYHPLYFDIDGKRLKYAFDDAQCIYMFFKNFLKVPEENILVWFSGSKGFHIEVDSELFGLKPMINLQLINKEIAKMLVKKYNLHTIDIGSIYSKKRMWRLPFSINSKSGRRKTLIPKFDEFKYVTEVEMYVDELSSSDAIQRGYIEFLKNKATPTINPTLKTWISEYVNIYEANLFREVIKKNKDLYSKLKGELPKCIIHLLNNSISESGQRNIASVVLASFFKESGRSKEETIEILRNFTENIPNHLTSIKNGAIIGNVTSVVNAVYDSEVYSFQCYYIKPLLKKSGFRCNVNCSLKD